MRKFNKSFLALLVFLVASAVLIFTFSDQILSYSFEKYLIHFSKSALNSDLTHGGIISDREGWKVTTPRLETRGEGAGLDFSAHSLSIKVVPRWLKREADLYVHLVGPQLEIDSQVSELSDLIIKALSPVGFIRFRPHVVVENGELRLQKKDGETESLYFTLDASREKELKGVLIASLDDPELATPHLKVQFSNPQKHHYRIEVEADEFKAPLFANSVRFFYPQAEVYEIEEGLITGRLTIDLLRDKQPLAFGDFTLKQIHFRNGPLALRGQIQNAQVHIEENKNLQGESETIPFSTGHIELTEGATLTFEKNATSFCTLEDLKGNLYFQTSEGARLNLTGICRHGNQISQMKVQGLARFRGNEGNALDMSLELQGVDSGASPAKARFISRDLGAKFKFAEITFAQIGPQEFEFLQFLLVPHLPQLAQTHLIKGKMDASVVAYLKGMQLSDFKIEKLRAENLDFTIDRWETTAHIDSLSGHLEVNLASVNPLETLNANLLIEGGECIFKGVCDLTDLNTDLIIRKGVIQESTATAKFSGLEGILFLNGLDPEGEIVKIAFSGPIAGLSGLVPEKGSHVLQQKWSNDLISIKAGIKRIEKGIHIAGFFLLDNQKIDWNFDLKRHQKGSVDLADRLWQGVVKQLWQKSMGNLALHAAVNGGRQMNKEGLAGGFRVINGSFQTSQLVLEKYLSPFLFDDTSITLTGLGNFQGEFDQSAVAFNYQLDSAQYETDAMKWQFGRAAQPQGSGEDIVEPIQGYHCFDLTTRRSFGQLDLKKGVFENTRLKLPYRAVEAKIVWADKQLSWKDVKTESCGLRFAGQIELDLRHPKPGFSTTTIAIQQITGTFSQVQKYFSHFDDFEFLKKLPLEGELALGEKGAHLTLEHTPGNWEVNADLQGAFRNGHVLSHSPDMNIGELQFNFDYNQLSKSFLVKDIHAVLQIGEGEERYFLSGEKIHFTDCEKGQAEFDLWLGNQSRDIVRMAGKTVPTTQEDLSGALDLVIDKKLTHFGDVHPERFELTFKDWNHIDKLQIDFGLSLATMLFDVQTLSRTGLLFLPKNLIAELNSFRDGKGDFQVSIDYDAKTSLLNYKATASDVAVGEHRYQKCALQGKKKGATWAIDQLLLDDTSIAADLTRMTNSWKVNFMGLRIGQSLLVGLEGDYSDAEKVFEGKVNLFEVDLSKLKEWPSLVKFQGENNPKGHFRGTGQVHLESKLTGKRNWNLEFVLNGTVRDPQFRNLAFQDSQNISLHFVSDRGLTLRNIHTALKEGEGARVLGLLDVEKIDFDTSTDALSLERFHFNFPVENVFFTVQRLKESFPNAISEEWNRIVNRLKDSNNLEGTFDLKKSNEGAVVELSLPEGKYRFNDQWHEVNNFKLRYDWRELKLISQYRYHDHSFWVYLKTTPGNLSEGIAILADYHPELQKPIVGQQPLRIEWKNEPEKGFTIHQANGFLAGMEIHLAADPEHPADKEAIYLLGQMRFNPSRAGCLISQSFADTCKELVIQDGYSLKGLWRLGRNQTMRFSGVIEGQDFILKGYQLQNLSAKVHYEHPVMTVTNLRIVDNSGNVQIDQMNLVQEGNELWKMSIPKITVTNFKPSLLREFGDPPKISKPLLVRAFEIQNLTGWTGAPVTWTGKGSLQFANPPKKNLQNTILAIPAEILTLIGLDLTVLNPVSGTILFDVKEGKFVLTKFKDVYSEGRLSKFHLTHPKISTVDFEGNLDVQIRMKQYNLFFKLAELLTFNVNGTLLKPTYSLNKQRKL